MRFDATKGPVALRFGKACTDFDLHYQYCLEKGSEARVVYVGDAIAYKKGITVTDNSGAEIPLQIDSSAVRADTPGEYPVNIGCKEGNNIDVDANDIPFTPVTAVVTVK